MLDNFTTSINKLIDDKIDLAETKITRKSIAADLEISEETLKLYESCRIPSSKFLPAIRQYFDVPYSTIFGETTSKDLENVKKELCIGLNAEAMANLEKIQSKALNDTYSTNYEDKFKLLIINSIICDEKLINDISGTFAYYLGQIEMEKKLAKNGIQFRNPKDDYYQIHLYRFIGSIERRFDELAKSNSITPEIKKLAYKVAKKYSGDHQKYLD